MQQQKPIHYLADKLLKAPHIKAVRRHDDDALRVELDLGETIVIYLLASYPSTRRLGVILSQNTSAGRHTVFAVADDLLRADYASPALVMLRHLYPRHVYAFKIIDEEIVVLPVNFELPDGEYRYDMPVDITEFQLRHFEQGRICWLVADFGLRQFWQPRQASYRNGQQRQHYTARPPRPVEAPHRYYDVLGIAHTASKDDIKRAYRILAQAFHPDMNDAPEANEKMQMLNEAYRYLMRK